MRLQPKIRRKNCETPSPARTTISRALGPCTLHTKTHAERKNQPFPLPERRPLHQFTDSEPETTQNYGWVGGLSASLEPLRQVHVAFPAEYRPLGPPFSPFLSSRLDVHPPFQRFVHSHSSFSSFSSFPPYSTQKTHVPKTVVVKTHLPTLPTLGDLL